MENKFILDCLKPLNLPIRHIRKTHDRSIHPRGVAKHQQQRFGMGAPRRIQNQSAVRKSQSSTHGNARTKQKLVHPKIVRLFSKGHGLMTHEAGKGDKRRPEDSKAFMESFDRIFRPQASTQEKMRQNAEIEELKQITRNLDRNTGSNK